MAKTNLFEDKQMNQFKVEFIKIYVKKILL